MQAVARGLIPACAGKTDLSDKTALPVWAHPRVCGENVRMSDEKGPIAGSSPRVRGKPLRGPRGSSCERLIPACAGKTKNNDTVSVYAWAHPRVCGENGKYAGSPVLKSGSSPRVRGKPTRALDQVTINRLIPACAGKT